MVETTSRPQALQKEDGSIGCTRVRARETHLGGVIVWFLNTREVFSRYQGYPKVGAVTAGVPRTKVQSFFIIGVPREFGVHPTARSSMSTFPVLPRR